MAHPPGTIIVPNVGLLRQTQFVADLFALAKPEGTHVSFPQSGSVTQALNTGLLNFVGEWAWLQADDHAFNADLLLQLLNHEVDIVCPLIVRRSHPDQLVLGKEIKHIDELTGRVYPAYESMRLDEMPSRDSLFTVEIAGTGGMLISRRVFEAIGFPYFESTDGLYLNEDIEFSRKVRAKGFQIHVDPQARMGHIIGRLTTWPY